jgi:hypothetical protein
MTDGTSRVRRFTAAAAGLAAAVAAVTACHSGAGSGSGAGHPVQLRAATTVRPAEWVAACRSAPAASRLLVRRVGGDRAQLSHLRAPAAATVTNVAVVQQVEHALCLLPRRPAGTYHCPAGAGFSYSLYFRVGALALSPVTLEPAGCQLVSGMAGPVRWTARSPQFWRTLGRALGLSRPSVTAFSGQPGEG